MSITFTTHNGPEVNFNNRNAATMLQLLGLPVEQEGECPAEDFLGRVLTAQALAHTAVDDQHGLPAHIEGRWWEGGRRPGYIAERLTDLEHLAERAVSQHTDVSWL